MNDELQELRRRCERLELLQQVSHTIHSTLEPEEALRLILREAVRLTHASSGSIVLVNPGTQRLEIHASVGIAPDGEAVRLRLGQGITGWVARTGRAARVGDVSKDPRYIAVCDGTRSELAVPLPAQEGVRGLLNVESERPDAFTEEDQSLLEALAAQAAGAIRHTWLYERLRHKARLFEALASVGRAISSTLNLDEALTVVTREAAGLMSARMCSLMLLDESGEWLDLRASHGASADYVNKPRLSVVESLVGVVIRRRKPAQVEDVRTSGRYQNIAVAQREGLASLLSVPLLFQGRTIGVLNIYTATPHPFSNEEVALATALAELSAIAIEKARLYERVVDVEEQLRQNEKFSALGLLAAEVAHEIRNPLTVMKLLYHSLDLRFDEDDPRSTDARIMGEKMDHLNRIVERVLDYARTAEPRFAPVDVDRIIDEMGLLVRHKLRDSRVELRREPGANLPPIHADASQIEQVFLNLTLNAAEAMPDGGRLTISTQRDEDHVLVTFTDTGAGMTEEQQRRAFTSLLHTTKQKGAGLGLAIVAKIVEAHGGTITLRSVPGHGTTFEVRLPCGGV